MSSKVLIKMYNDLDIRCVFENCKKVVKLLDLAKHESICQRPKCWNFDLCEGNDLGNKTEDFPCCSVPCALLKPMMDASGNQKKMYEAIKKFFETRMGDLVKKDSSVAVSAVTSTLGSSTKAISVAPQGGISFRWDTTKGGQGIEITEGGQAVFLREQSYVFRTVVAEAVLTHII